MTSGEKRSLIDSFEKSSDAFDDVLKLPPEVLKFRPFPDAWSILEQIVHCLDVDAANFHRYRRGIAQPETQVLGFDGTWTSALDYQSHDLEETVALIRLIRRYMAGHLRRLVDHDWKHYAYIHSQYGRIDLERAIADYTDHVRFHRELIDRNLKLWEQKDGRKG
ncbi:DinB family protein [bacterium]|nr:DinB family protein [bacterium]